MANSQTRQDTLIEIGSKGNVILKFNTEVCINGNIYSPGEPYLFLRDVNVHVSYGNTEKSATKQQALAAYSNIYPQSILIRGASFSRRLAALMASTTGERKIFHKNEMKTLKPEEDTKNYFLLDGGDAAKPVFVYEKENFKKIESDNYIVMDEFGSLAIEGVGDFNFDLNTTYIVFFSSVVVGAEFDLVKPHLPYMTMEIQGLGNINKNNSVIVMEFQKVSLNSVVDFNFIEDGVINAPLEFVVLKGSNKMWYQEDGE